MTSPKKIRKTADAIRLERTCEACPEQYDAYYGARAIGYLRLRYGVFRVKYTYETDDLLDAPVVLLDHPHGDGCFDDDEREDFLDRAKVALAEAWWASPQAKGKGR